MLLNQNIDENENDEEIGIERDLGVEGPTCLLIF